MSFVVELVLLSVVFDIATTLSASSSPSSVDVHHLSSMKSTGHVPCRSLAVLVANTRH